MDISGGKYISLTAADRINDPRIMVVKIFGFTMMNREFIFESKGIRADINHDDANFAAFFGQIAERLIAVGAIEHGAVEVRPGGLNGILSGLEDLKAGTVHRKRLVYLIE
ncbi:hypothetical protein TrVFT333_003417 [Trichoderma virens FT-333]|nr:hypothetical protein TrVFT333_003417 [Trichoderma virens FT-333]